MNEFRTRQDLYPLNYKKNGARFTQYCGIFFSLCYNPNNKNKIKYFFSQPFSLISNKTDVSSAFSTTDKTICQASSN